MKYFFRVATMPIGLSLLAFASIVSAFSYFIGFDIDRIDHVIIIVADWLDDICEWGEGRKEHGDE